MPSERTTNSYYANSLSLMKKITARVILQDLRNHTELKSIFLVI